MMKSLPRILALLLVSWTIPALFAPRMVLGDVFRYVDDNGVTHFTDAPTNPSYHLYYSERANIGDMISYYARAFKMEEALLRAVIKVESDYRPNVVSHKGAMGLMQLIPETASDLKVDDPMDISQNIRGGTQYLKRMLIQFGDLDLALAAYNAGPSAVKRYGGVPPYQETVNYVRRVKEYLEIFRVKKESGL